MRICHVFITSRKLIWGAILYYNDVIMRAMASPITNLTIVYSTVYSRRRKHQSLASLAFVRGIHRWPVNSPHNGPVTRKMFSFDDVIMILGVSHEFTTSRRGKLMLSPLLPSLPVAILHDDVIKRKHFPRYWPFVRAIHRPSGFFLNLRLNKRFSKQSRRQCLETSSHSLWRHRNLAEIMALLKVINYTWFFHGL